MEAGVIGGSTFAAAISFHSPLSALYTVTLMLDAW